MLFAGRIWQPPMECTVCAWMGEVARMAERHSAAAAQLGICIDSNLLFFRVDPGYWLNGLLVDRLCRSGSARAGWKAGTGIGDSRGNTLTRLSKKKQIS